jgi:hypothetical protein
MTSPFNIAAIADAAEGAVTRMSDRVIDCPVKMMLSADGCGHTVAPMANIMAAQVAAIRSRPRFDVGAISCSPRIREPEHVGTGVRDRFA